MNIALVLLRTHRRVGLECDPTCHYCCRDGNCTLFVDSVHHGFEERGVLPLPWRERKCQGNAAFVGKTR